MLECHVWLVGWPPTINRQSGVHAIPPLRMSQTRRACGRQGSAEVRHRVGFLRKSMAPQWRASQHKAQKKCAVWHPSASCCCSTPRRTSRPTTIATTMDWRRSKRSVSLGAMACPKTIMGPTKYGIFCQDAAIATGKCPQRTTTAGSSCGARA